MLQLLRELPFGGSLFLYNYLKILLDFLFFLILQKEKTMNLKFSNTPIGRFRLIGLLEGLSFLILLLIAMPLKHFAGLPDAVKYTGWLHGLLFILYLFSLLHVTLSNKWSFMRLILAVLASLIPFGTFLLDKKLQIEEQELVKSSK